MAALNYYLAFQRGQEQQQGLVTAGTSSAGTAVDVECRLQINNGTNATGLTKLDCRLLLEAVLQVIESNSQPTFLPVL